MRAACGREGEVTQPDQIQVHHRPRRDGTAQGAFCGGSVAVANLAEGFGRKSHRDFARFLYTAKASAVEVTSHLYLASDLEYLDKDALEELLDGYDHVQRMLMNLIKHLESN